MWILALGHHRCTQVLTHGFPYISGTWDSCTFQLSTGPGTDPPTSALAGFMSDGASTIDSVPLSMVDSHAGPFTEAEVPARPTIYGFC